MFAIIAVIMILGLPLAAVAVRRSQDTSPYQSKPSKEALRAEAMANHPAGKGR